MRTLLLLVLLINSISLFAQTNNPYFEGTIEYLISYKSQLDGISADQLSELKGSRMLYSVENGKTAKEYFNDQKVLIEKRVFLPDNCKNIQWHLGKDSLFEYDPSYNNFRTLSYKELPDTVIDGLVLKGIQLILQDKRERTKVNVIYTYYFYENLRANPAWYSCYKEGDWNRIIKKMKSFCYWYKIENAGFYSAEFKSIRVNRDFVNEAAFQFPPCSGTIRVD